MRRIARYLPLFFLTLCCIQFAAAQSSFDVNVGFGSFHDKSTGTGIDTSTFGSCTVGSTSSTCKPTPALSGFFMGGGGSLMLKKHFGVGAQYVATPVKKDYGPLNFRQHFWDLNGIYAPINEKKVAVHLLGGIGGAKTGFSYTQTGCVGTAVCNTQTQPVGSSNHFQIHAGAGVQIFVTDHVFIRPQFDLHYVPNLTQQFGSNVVPGGMIWIGYSVGDR